MVYRNIATDMISNTAAGRDGVRRIQAWLHSRGVNTRLSKEPAPFDLYTLRGTRIEAKSASFHGWSAISMRGNKTQGWFFNIHRHGILNEGDVDFYVLRCEPSARLREIGFSGPIHLIVRAPLRRSTIAITVRRMITRWCRHFDAIPELLAFDAEVDAAHRQRTLEIGERGTPWVKKNTP